MFYLMMSFFTVYYYATPRLHTHYTCTYLNYYTSAREEQRSSPHQGANEADAMVVPVPLVECSFWERTVEMKNGQCLPLICNNLNLFNLMNCLFYECL